MTEPVILKHCDACEAETLHAREQEGKPDPARVVTEHVCSECGAIESKVQTLHE